MTLSWSAQSSDERQAEAWMRRALEVAATTPAGDVPVGAIVVNAAGCEIAAATNRREADGDPTAHAEVLALRQAARHRQITGGGDGVAADAPWRLADCTLVVTLEPCTMCAGAAVGARVGRVIFGAFEPKTGACGSARDVLREGLVLHVPQVRGGVLESACAGMLSEFFRGKR